MVRFSVVRAARVARANLGIALFVGLPLAAACGDSSEGNATIAPDGGSSTADGGGDAAGQDASSDDAASTDASTDASADADAGVTCSTIGAGVAAHVNGLAATNWRATNAANMMTMYGCAGAANTRACLASAPRANTTGYGATWEADLPGAVLRILHTTAYKTSYVTRISPDGRFVGHGAAGAGSQIVDLQRAVTVPIAADYDPSFFPDGSGFVFQGGARNVCAQTVLTSDPSAITTTESGCANLGAIGLHQSVGVHLGGGDAWAVSGEFVSDNGGLSTATLTNPDVQYGPSSNATLTPLVFNGTQYVAKQNSVVAIPSEGDAVLSPSARLLMTRVRGADLTTQNGRRLYALTATANGNAYTVTKTEIAHYCAEDTNGSVPVISFDERWAVYHRYVEDSDAVKLGFTGPGDPAFATYKTQGAANVMLLDLVTGAVKRVTRMGPGQYALYPSFRSDGWIYFVVRTLGEGTERIVASDAALL